MSNVTDLWTACVNAHSKYRGKGVLALMGKRGDVEIGRIFSDEVVVLIEKQPDVETACKALLKLFLDECVEEVKARETQYQTAKSDLDEIQALLSV